MNVRDCESTFVFLAAHHDGTLAVYGPFLTYGDAADMGTLPSMHDDTVAGTQILMVRPIPALLPVPAEFVTGEDVVSVSRNLAEAVPCHDETADSGAIVVFVPETTHSAVSVGPFWNQAYAHRWVAELPEAYARMRGRVLPLRQHPATRIPAVVYVPTVNGTAVYGPFTTAMQADRWLFETLSRRDADGFRAARAHTVTRVRRGLPDSGPLLTDSGAPLELYVVLITDDGEMPERVTKMFPGRAVGWFCDEDETHMWWKAQSVVLPGVVGEVNEVILPY